LTGVHIDTTTPHGMFALQLFAAHAQTARALIQGQVIAGLVAARARRRTGGRCPKLSPEQQHLAADIAQGGISITTIATTLGGSRHTVYKALGQAHAALDLEEAGTAD